MPPVLASLVCNTFVAYLFWNDIRKRGATTISWAPFFWMFLAGSRWVSSWLSMSPPMDSPDALAEGSPLDRAAFGALIVWGATVLARRHIAWPKLFGQNKWIVLYFLYCLTSMVWAPEPLLLAKRWIKDLGNPIIALVLLTEERPFEAVGITLRRLSFVLLPWSVLFVKFYPALGRAYHNDGSPMYTGVGHQKNDLGLMCLMTGLYFGWKLLQRRQGGEATEKSDTCDYVLILMLAWLLQKSDSQTSFACLIVAILVMLIARLPPVSWKPSRIVLTMASVGVVFAFLQATFQIKDYVLLALGRDSTLTSRTEIWEVVGRFEGSPLVGVGFMSFWTGDRLTNIWQACQCQINQAHNGYIEQFVNLGYVGVAFICLIMAFGVFAVRRDFNTQPAAALLRFCFIIVAALYNYTEASFYGISNIWVLLLLGSIDMRGVCPDGAMLAETTLGESPTSPRPPYAPFIAARRSPGRSLSPKHGVSARV